MTFKRNEQQIEWLLSKIEHSTARMRKLISLDAPEHILQNEKEIILSFAGRLEVASPKVVAEAAEINRKVKEEEPLFEARVKARYEDAGNTVPWNDADSEVRNFWLTKILDEELGIETPKFPERRKH